MVGDPLQVPDGLDPRKGVGGGQPARRHRREGPGAMIALVALAVLPVLWRMPETAPRRRPAD